MTIQFYRPIGPLSSVVSLMVFHRGYRPAHTVERFLPDGSIDLVIDLSDHTKYVFDNESLDVRQECRYGWISGMRTAPISISVGSGNAMLVVTLVASAARRLVRHPMHLFADRVVDASDVLGRSFTELRARLLTAPNPSSCFVEASSWIMSRLAADETEPLCVRESVALIGSAPTARKISWYAENAGISGKHLSRQFRDYVGVGPKQFQRIHRFQSVLRTVEEEADADWARVAVDHGFFDQSHLISEFRSFAGCSPTEYLATRGDLLNYVPVGGR